jgi:Mg2+ and Co2+ transporter CorA
MSSASVLNRIAAEEGELDRMYARDTLSHLEQLLQQTKSLQTLQQSSDDAARAARELRSKGETTQSDKRKNCE